MTATPLCIVTMRRKIERWQREREAISSLIDQLERQVEEILRVDGLRRTKITGGSNRELECWP